MRKLLTVYRLIFAGVLCLVVAIFMYHLQTGKWLQTDLHTFCRTVNTIQNSIRGE